MTKPVKRVMEEGVVVDTRVAMHMDLQIRQLFGKKVRILPETIEKVINPQTNEVIGERAIVLALNCPPPEEPTTLMLNCIKPTKFAHTNF